MFTILKFIVGFFARWAAKLFLLGILFLIYQGITGVYTAFRESKQTVITCQDFLATRPKNKWLKITEAKPNFRDMVNKIEFGKITEAYIPIIPNGSEPKAKTALILTIKAKDYPALQEFADAGDNFSKQLVAYTKIATSPEFEKSIDGMVRYGLDDDDKTRRELQKLIPNLERDYAIIEKGEIPSMSKALAKFGYAFICLISLLVTAFIAELCKPPKAADSPNSSPPPIPT